MMCFVLYSLNPCPVKEALLYSAGIDYAQPLHKSKTTVPAGTCQYSADGLRHIHAVKQLKINRQPQPADFACYYRPAIQPAGTYNNHTKTSPAGNSPPKYILYKRLKVNLA